LKDWVAPRSNTSPKTPTCTLSSRDCWIKTVSKPSAIALDKMNLIKSIKHLSVKPKLTKTTSCQPWAKIAPTAKLNGLSPPTGSKCQRATFSLKWPKQSWIKKTWIPRPYSYKSLRIFSRMLHLSWTLTQQEQLL
jgi:hypothetical protein